MVSVRIVEINTSSAVIRVSLIRHCLSWICPTQSLLFLKTLDNFIKHIVINEKRIVLSEDLGFGRHLDKVDYSSISERYSDKKPIFNLPRGISA